MTLLPAAKLTLEHFPDWVQHAFEHGFWGISKVNSQGTSIPGQKFLIVEALEVQLLYNHMIEEDENDLKPILLRLVPSLAHSIWENYDVRDIGTVEWPKL